jgi:hypothetical protein
MDWTPELINRLWGMPAGKVVMTREPEAIEVEPGVFVRKLTFGVLPEFIEDVAMQEVLGICETCYEVKPDCLFVWMSPEGRDGCTHPGAPIKLCQSCRGRREGRFTLADLDSPTSAPKDAQTLDLR